MSGSVGMDAIGLDEYGKAKIDYDLCVSCGQCLVNCPFGAIVDKSQIYQVIRSILEEMTSSRLLRRRLPGSSAKT